MEVSLLGDRLLHLCAEDGEEKAFLEKLQEKYPDFVYVIAPVPELDEGAVIQVVIDFNEIMLKTDLLDDNLNPKSVDELLGMAEQFSKENKALLREWRSEIL